MKNEFPYDRLATPSTIRLVRLEEKKHHGLIVCTVCYKEQSQFTYRALSYRWGDDTETRQIYLRRRPGGTRYLFPVHDSLGRFLDLAWNHRLFESWLWTDKICLNQRDGTEKKQQIPRMGDIFRNAKKVLIWLDMTKRDIESLSPILDIGGYSLGRRWESSRNIARFSVETRLAAVKLSQLEYWRRVWVVQEYASAKEAI
ncbi:heterokaryon incompatibility protein-domain-containing protein, partial [Phyllosticta citriasiana]